ncbi:MAG TPA: S1 RNA-binding domain-containing protein, partial [Acidobacteriota bacterium]|nr:S1 RNA-binding domain-containing protein [Acidobacteriota bacterium]
QLKERADQEAIRVFQENLANLLLSPPAGRMVVAGLDMVKSGECTLAVVDEAGKFLESCVVRFAPPRILPARNPQNAKIAKSTAAAPKAAEHVEPQSTGPEAVTEAARVDEPPETAPLRAPAEAADVAMAGSDVPNAEAVPEAETAAGSTDIRTDLDAPAVTSPETEPAAIVAAVPEPAVGESPDSESVDTPVSQAPSTPESATALEGISDPNPASPGEPSQVIEPAAETSEPSSVPEASAASPVADSIPSEAAIDVNPPVAAAPPTLPPETPAVDYMAMARTSILGLVAKHSVKAIAIGSGTGARELEATLRQILADEKIEDILVAAVNDAGIAVYSSSRVAREELPDLTVSARCAVSLARRLQDPLAEMVKIDPKLIGVGQYQHDVDQKELHRGLLQTVQSCVNKVGVDLNTAGHSLLRYVSGLNDRLAHRIVGTCTASPFPSRHALLTVPGFDSAAFEQAAGFLRIRGGENPLDATAVHPERYPIVERMAATLGIGVSDLIGNRERISSLKLEEFVDEGIGLPTLHDIREELLRPGRDPRKTFALPKFRSDVKDLSDLKKGMTLEGTVTNVTNFGAFVDIGVHQDGLVHLSQMSNRFIRDPREAVKVGDVVQVKVISVEAETKRIGLSMKALMSSGRRRRKVHKPGARPPQAEGVHKTGERTPAVTAADPSRNAPPPGPERGRRREGEHSRPRRRDDRRAERPPRTAAPETKSQAPEPSLQEKIAILQSKFRGIN